MQNKIRRRNDVSFENLHLLDNMVDLEKLQKQIYQNKIDKGFNVTDINKEFCLAYGEMAEAYET